MSDTNQGIKKTLLLILILLLVLFVGIQTWYIVEMQKQLDDIHNQSSATQSQLHEQMQNQEQDVSTIAKELAETSSVATAAAANNQLSSLAEKEVVSPAQKPVQQTNKNVTNDAPSALPQDDDSTTPLDIQAWNPYAESQRIPRGMDRRFDRRPYRYEKRPDYQYQFSQSLSTPKIDVKENDNQYTVFVNLPGASEKDISVTLNGQRLTIKAKQNYKKQESDETGNIIFQTRQSGRFQRSITLPDPVIQNAMQPHLDNGVLMIIIPKVKYRQQR